MVIDSTQLDVVVRGLIHQVYEFSPEGCRHIVNDEMAIVEVENRLAINFPGDYRYFLKQYGGIQINNALVRPAARDDERIGWEDSVGMMSFYGIYGLSPEGRESSYNLVTVTNRNGLFLPSGIVPIAEFGSTLFCISCTGGNRGRIFLKAPEQFDDDKPEDFLFPQAPSFLDFLQSLKTMTDEEANAWYRARGG